MQRTNRRSRARFALCALVLAACAGTPNSNGGERSEATTQALESEEPGATPQSRDDDASGAVVGGFYRADGAPDPLACGGDSDCVASGVLAANGCCWSYRNANLVAQTTAYRDWTSAQREACDTDACGPPPAPTRPDDCLFEVSCVEGQCVNACAR